MASYAVASLFFRFVFRLGGAMNVALILTTRPNVLLFGSRGLLAHNDPRLVSEEVDSISSRDDGSEAGISPISMIGYTNAARNRPPSVRTK